MCYKCNELEWIYIYDILSPIFQKHSKYQLHDIDQWFSECTLNGFDTLKLNHKRHITYMVTTYIRTDSEWVPRHKYIYSRGWSTIIDMLHKTLFWWKNTINIKNQLSKISKGMDLPTVLGLHCSTGYRMSSRVFILFNIVWSIINLWRFILCIQMLIWELRGHILRKGYSPLRWNIFSFPVCETQF